MFPYTIEGLRQHNYQSGPIHIRERLELSDVYTSYLFDYSSDGLTITGVMQVPQGEPPFPVIVLNHGYFNRDEYKSGDGTDRIAVVLNHAGYLTLAPDYRSWGGSDVGESFFYSGMVIDVINLLNAIPSIPEADTSRIGMLGHSMGGGITTRVLTIDLRVKAAVLYSTTSADTIDLVRRWGLGCIGDVDPPKCDSADIIPASTPDDLVQAYLASANDLKLLEATSPIYSLELVSAPIQIHAGAEDGQDIGSTPPDWSQQLYDALLLNGKPAELFIYPGQKHSFVGEGRDLFLQRVVKFFDKWVKGGG
jgi:dipeptidyl aminopeptidase/acylaminoacyl peptidase